MPSCCPCVFVRLHRWFSWTPTSGKPAFPVHACVGSHLCVHMFPRIKVLCQTCFGVHVGDALHPPSVAAGIVPWSSSRQPETLS